MGVQIPPGSEKGQWSRGMILALGARGRGFESLLAPFLFLSKNLSKIIYKISFIVDRSAVVAQLGERQTEDLKVPGSIPGDGNYFVFFFIFNLFYFNFFFLILVKIISHVNFNHKGA